MHLLQRLFATVYDPVMAPLEHGRVGHQRTALLAQAYGHVLDLGAGTGANLEHLPASVDRVTAIEPDPAMRAHLVRHLSRLAASGSHRWQVMAGAGEGTGMLTTPAPATLTAPAATVPRRMQVEVVDAVAEALPLPDASVDVAIATLVLCTVSDPELAVAELRRVLRPGGELLVLEHVASHQPGRLRLQHAITPAWKVVARGCHLDRDTRATLATGGFDVSDVTAWQLSDNSRLTAAITGVARPA
ncbi:MAG: class I SAM-dependent methyltransferase [Nitriliruptoraceae bacterium]